MSDGRVSSSGSAERFADSRDRNAVVPVAEQHVRLSDSEERGDGPRDPNAGKSLSEQYLG